MVGPNDSIFTETKWKYYVCIFENKSQKLLCYNMNTCKQKYIHYDTNCQLMFISKKIFIVFDDDKIIAYNNEFIPYYNLTIYVIKIYILSIKRIYHIYKKTNYTIILL